jgi:predicted amidohydrolase YtcJ
MTCTDTLPGSVGAAATPTGVCVFRSPLRTHCSAVWAGGSRPGVPGSLPSWPTRYADRMPLDTLITGRIATLAGDDGFGWVEAIGIRDGRIAFAGSEVFLETRADPHTLRIALEPDEVAIPGLTDAHLHLAQAALARHHVDLGSAVTLDEGLERIAAAHRGLAGPEMWLEGHGWDSDRWGRWPTADDLEAAAPGRRVALWAHDHHALWVSRAALTTAGVDRTTEDPAGGVIRRGTDDEPEGVLYEAAARLVMVHLPPPVQADLERGIVEVGRELLALGVVACHDPGGVSPDPDLNWSFPGYAALSDAGRLPVRVHASVRQDALATAIARGLRSGDPIGEDRDGRGRVGWQKAFADGSLGSRTAALLADIESEPDRPLPPERRRGVWMTDPAELADHARRAFDAGIATQIHAIGDAAVRAALDVLEPVARGLPFMPRIEHVQLVDPADRPRFAAAGIAASVQPVHLRSDADQARRLWGARAESAGYAWKSLVETGAVVPFGTDAPVEPFDPWPGIALAVRREDRSWPAGTLPFGPDEAMTLDRALRAACVDPAVSAGEKDRGRLTVGQRADVVILPAAALEDPVEPGGALATARPHVVLVDGEYADL